MKAIYIKFTLLVSLLLAFVACSDNMGDTDNRLAAVNGLTEPSDGKSIVLESSVTATAYFEWQEVDVKNVGTPIYQIAFDRADGDFSNPVYTTLADNNGYRNSITITHKQLNKIAGKVGIASTETGTLKWTVFTSKGTQSLKSSQENKITITRIAGFDELPGSLYLVGDAVEGGSMVCVAPSSGEFEAFLTLEGGKSFTMNTAANASGTSYCITGNNIKEGDEGYTVEKTGIYRVAFDFNVASLVHLKEIKNLGMFLCEKGEVPEGYFLNYEGNGVWANNCQLDRITTSWGSDERYRFLMTYADGSQIIWGAIASNDGKPNGAPAGDEYYKLYEYSLSDPADQWALKWKWDSQFDYNLARVSVTFNVPVYTHYIESPK